MFSCTPIDQRWDGKENRGVAIEVDPIAAERAENDLKGFQDVRTTNGSSGCQNLALTGWHVLSSLDSGRFHRDPSRRRVLCVYTLALPICI